MPHDELVKKWTEVCEAIVSEPFKQHDCPLCNKGKLEIYILPVGSGVSVSLQCKQDEKHQTHINFGIHSN